jgi:hypothetical protein
MRNARLLDIVHRASRETRRGSCVGGGELHGEAKVLEALEHGVDGAQEGGGDGANGFLGASAGLDSMELGVEAAALGSSGRAGAGEEGAFNQREPLRIRVHLLLPALSSLRGRMQAKGEEMGVRGIAAHVDADLGQNGLSAEVVEARDGPYDLGGLAKGVEIGLHLLVERRDRPIEGVDLLQMELEQEAVVSRQAAPQRLSQAPPAWL